MTKWIQENPMLAAVVFAGGGLAIGMFMSKG